MSQIEGPPQQDGTASFKRVLGRPKRFVILVPLRRVVATHCVFQHRGMLSF
jgi:hypothetical protein